MNGYQRAETKRASLLHILKLVQDEEVEEEKEEVGEEEGRRKKK